jgi:hypothetical protein
MSKFSWWFFAIIVILIKVSTILKFFSYRIFLSVLNMLISVCKHLHSHTLTQTEPKNITFKLTVQFILILEYKLSMGIVIIASALYNVTLNGAFRYLVVTSYVLGIISYHRFFLLSKSLIQNLEFYFYSLLLNWKFELLKSQKWRLKMFVIVTLWLSRRNER